MVLLPDDVHFYEDVRLLAWRPRGLLNEPTVNKVIGVLEDLEAKLKEPFNRFSDTSAIDRIELNYRYIIHISLYRVLSYGDQPPVKSAILTADSAIARYFQLHAIITEGSPIKVRIFQEREDAAKWLGVPLKRLARNWPLAEHDTGPRSSGRKQS